MFSMLSEKGRDLLVFEDFKFRKAVPTKKGQKWRCTNRFCRATFFTDSSGNMIGTPVHNDHGPEKNIPRQFVSNSVKRKAVEDISIRPAKLVRTEACKAPDEIRKKLDREDLELARKNCYAHKRSVFPPLPKDVHDVHNAVDSVNVKAKDGQNLLLVNDRSQNIIIFAALTSLAFLCNLSTAYMDGTFTYSTAFFTQLFTIHGLKNGHYVPLVFCLLPNKAASTYEAAFRLIVNKCLEHGLTFYPERIVVDFEISIHLAIKVIWSAARIVGCRFHLKQAWYRKIVDLSKFLFIFSLFFLFRVHITNRAYG